MKKGTFHSKETRGKISRTLIGHKVSTETRLKQKLAKLGKPISEKHKKHISEANKRDGIKPPTYFGENHPKWNKNVGYMGLHAWVRKHLGKPNICEHCGKSGLSGKKIHWANKSHKYLRDLTDWLRLCVPCHKKYDYVSIS